MRWILKIFLFPISLLLSILTTFLTFLLAIGTTILYLLMLTLMLPPCLVPSYRHRPMMNSHRAFFIYRRILNEQYRN